jgi:hypothetical protein
MDSLAPLVLAQQRRKLQYSRRLQSVLLPTAIFDFQEIGEFFDRSNKS